MVQGLDYIFCLIDANNKFYRILADGTVSLSTEPYFLEFSPSGWNDIAIQNVKNKRYWSIDRSLTLPLDYVRDGAKIIKDVFYKKGINETMYLVISGQELEYHGVATGTLTVITGGNPLTSGANTGTITGPPNATAYIRIQFTQGGGLASINGTIGSQPVNLISLTPSSLYTIQLDGTGSASYSLVFTPSTGIPTSATMDIVNQDGQQPGYGFWYKRLYKGEIDFSNFSHESAKVNVATLEDGLPKFLKSNENTVYEFNMNVPEAVMVKMDGIKLHEKLNYNDISEMPINFSYYGQSFRMPTTFITNEGDSVGVEYQSQSIESTTGFSWDDRIKLDNYVFKNLNSFPVALKISGVTEIKCTGMVSSPAYGFRARFITSDMDLVDQNLYQIPFGDLGGGNQGTPPMTIGETYSAEFVIENVIVNPNQHLSFEGFFSGGAGVEAVIEMTKNSNFKIEFISRHPATYIRAFRPNYLFSYLVSKITELQYVAALSAYFENYKNVVFTSGNSLRGIDSAKLKTSFSSFFQFWDCFDSVALVNKTSGVDVLRKKDTVDITNSIRINSPENGSVKISVATDYLFNELEIGQPELDNEVGQINGNNEYNTKMLFSTGVSKAPAKLDKVTKYKTSCYEAEKVRLQTFEKDTTDYKDDNTVYVLHIEDELQPPDGDSVPAHYKLDRSLNDGASGLLEPETVFNILFTPKRSILRNSDFIHSCFYKGDAEILAFKSADKNSELVAGGIIEKADINIGSLSSAFFIPIYIEGSFPPPANLSDILEEDPFKTFVFDINGEDFIGIMMENSINPSKRNTQNYEFLSIASNDLTKLIDYYG